MNVPGLRRAGMVDMEANTTLVQQYPAHEAVPDGVAPAPAVVLLHDLWGLTPGIRALANRLAREGFFLLAPNLYAHPFSAAAGAPPWMSYPVGVAAEEGWDGFPVRASFRREESAEARALAAGLPRARVREIVDHAFGHLALASDADPGRVALLGYGFGGTLAFAEACALGEEVRAVVACSPGGLASGPHRADDTLPILDYEGLRVPALLLYGAADTEAPPAERDAVARVLRAAGLPHEIVVFPQAGRGFFDEESPDFRVAASQEAWRRIVAFLKENLAAR